MTSQKKYTRDLSKPKKDGTRRKGKNAPVGPNPSYKLTDDQRAQVLQWIAEGLTSSEINNLAASFDPPFSLTSPNFHYYYKKYGPTLAELRKEHESKVFNQGLAIAANRVKSLIRLAIMLEEDLEQKKLIWLQDAKTVAGEAYSFESFNKAELDTLRGIYDDIARETGGRIQKKDITSQGKALKGYVTVSPDDWDEEGPKEE